MIIVEVFAGGRAPPEAGGRGRLSLPWTDWRRANAGNVSGRSGAGLAHGARGRSAAGRLFPRGLHAARPDRPGRLPEQQGGVYDLLFRAAAETVLTIAADPKHLGARIGATAMLHSWGSAMTHHPHVHMIVPGGGISPTARAGCAASPASSCRCGSLPTVPAALPGGARRRPRRGPAGVLWRDRGSASSQGLRGTSRPAQTEELPSR